MDALGWVLAILTWTIGIVGIFCVMVAVIAIAYPVIVMFEELVLHRKSRFLLSDVDDPDKMHFFVDMTNEIVIPITTLGHSLHEFLINSDHKNFLGQGTNKERWKIVEQGRANEQHCLSRIEEWYRNYIHKTTGRVYIGFYPFRKVATKEINKKVKRHDAPHNGWFESVKSRSNHLRIRPFEWNFEVLDADVAGLIPVNVYGVLLFECVNPYESWYGIDAWDNQLSNAPVSIARNILKNWSVEDVLASDAKSQADTAAVSARRLEEELKKRIESPDEYSGEIFGFRVTKVQIFDVKPLLTPEQLEKARAGFYAGRLGDAYKTERRAHAEADSNYLETMSTQMKKDSEHGRFITEQDTRRNMAKDGKATIIFDGNGGATSSLEKTLMLVADRLEQQPTPPSKQGGKK